MNTKREVRTQETRKLTPEVDFEPVRRTATGSIDYAYYIRRAHRLRSEAFYVTLTALGRFLRGAIMNLSRFPVPVFWRSRQSSGSAAAGLRCSRSASSIQWPQRAVRMVREYLGALLWDAITRWRHWHHARVAYRELMALDDRELRDIGISRADIPAIARGTWEPPPGRKYRPPTGKSKSEVPPGLRKVA